jgi:YggT family protein
MDLFMFGLRIAVFGLFAASAVVAAVHWAVKHGHLSPFNALSRGVRRLSEPALKPLERRLHRSGGNPVNAPYVLFWVALVGGLAVLALAGWLINTVFTLGAAAAAGPRGLLYVAVNSLFAVLMFALFVRVISSWFGTSPYSWWMRLVHGLTDWLLDPLRRLLPPMGMLDFSPLLAYLMLLLAQRFVLSLL